MRFRPLATTAAFLFTAALAGFHAAAAAQQPITLKFHTFHPPQSNTWKGMVAVWMDKVEKESGGRIKFERYPAMQLGGNPSQLYDQVRDGVADVTWTSPGYTAGRFPRIEAFELPFMMTTSEATSKAAWEYLQTYAKDEFKDTHLIAANVHGPGVIHSRDKQISTIADLRGLKVRGPTRVTTKLLAALGAAPVGMAMQQIPDAISKGVIDAVVVPWEVVPVVKLEELVKTHTEFDPAAGGLYTVVFVVTMNKAKYESLPPDLKKVIDNNSGVETSGWLGKTAQSADLPARKLVEDRKHSVVTVKGPALAGFEKAAMQVQTEWAKEMDAKGMNGQQLIDGAKSLIQKHSK
jgi:TRAP-type C4-dicarboxylate transport system substrate-binding protein